MKFFSLFILLIGLFVGLAEWQPRLARYVDRTSNDRGPFSGESSQVRQLDTITVASGLDVPWEIIWGPDNKIWVTEQKGLVSRIDPQTGHKQLLLRLTDVWYLRTAGLLGMALHPDMKSNPYVFLNYTFLRADKPFSRLVRYSWKNDTLSNPKILMEIPANNGHSGSRLAFSKGKLFWATGDAASKTFAQDSDSPNGKILRLNIDGSIPSDNPVKGSPVWAKGFRNIQGMTFSSNGKLYTSEHGEATDDEVNLIEAYRNYGWPAVEGFADNQKEQEFKAAGSTADPLKAWTPTIAPAGIEYYKSGAVPQWKNSLLLVSLKGKSLRSLKLNDNGNTIVGEETYLENMFGRLRDVCISPEGDVYVSTSNRDWNRTMGDPAPNDDRIIKVFPSARGSLLLSHVSQPNNLNPASAAVLYEQYCASCHKQDGAGLPGIFPALKGSSLVKQGNLPLIDKILKGSVGTAPTKGVKYEGQMPAFAFLKDDEIASILNYVRAFHEEKYPLLQPGAISKVRIN